ncbi:MAG TPA: aminopeptidase [Actinomycetota bacterium]|jgi:leucyl aminopeptidase (aminopeptidase T)
MSLDTAVATVLDDCLGVRSGEAVLVVTDPRKLEIARALVAGARERGAEVVLAEMSERETHGTEPPPSIAAALLECELYIAPTSKSISHTDARKLATDKGIRGATMPDITEDMLERTMSADYAAIKLRSRALADALSNGSSVYITSPQGTDVTIPIGGRTGLSDDGDLKAPGAFGNLPAGEGFIAPVEGGTTGRIVFDGSIWPVGLLQSPLVVEIENGYAVDLSGASAAEFRSWIEPHGREAFAVAELGIGTNDSARLTGNVLEDEKILGTIHVAFGDNHSFGGKVRVSSHQDGIVTAPTVTIDGVTVLEDGRLLV